MEKELKVVLNLFLYVTFSNTGNSVDILYLSLTIHLLLPPSSLPPPHMLVDFVLFHTVPRTIQSECLGRSLIMQESVTFPDNTHLVLIY